MICLQETDVGTILQVLAQAGAAEAWRWVLTARSRPARVRAEAVDSERRGSVVGANEIDNDVWKLVFFSQFNSVVDV